MSDVSVDLKVYLVLHNHSGRVYIGQTKMDVAFRWQIHCRKSSGCLKLKYAIQKYGPEEFSVFELAHGLSQESADELEIALIKEHDSTRTGFNISVGGQQSWHIDTCRSGHDLRLADARDSIGRCRLCLRKNGKACYARLRVDPERWEDRKRKHNDYKKRWREERKQLGLRRS